MRTALVYVVLVVLLLVFMWCVARYCTADPTAVMDATTELING